MEKKGLGWVREFFRKSTRKLYNEKGGFYIRLDHQYSKNVQPLKLTIDVSFDSLGES